MDDALAASVPLLRKAALSFGTQQIRNSGNRRREHRERSPDRTLLTCLLALNATVQAASAGGGRRSMPLHGFLVGLGQTAIGPEDLLVAVTVPRVEGYQGYVMVGPRNAQYYRLPVWRSITLQAILAMWRAHPDEDFHADRESHRRPACRDHRVAARPACASGAALRRPPHRRARR
ncbi:MAG: FAD binding domain-containing protein [Rhodoplanes sp.]